jgi:beta-glucanase (GH16 family)
MARNILIILLAVEFILIHFFSCSGGGGTLPDYEYQGILIWSDEFDYTGLPDPAKWDYARVENGMLIIEARRDFYDGHEYSSARLITRGRFDWRFGRIEVCAKLPKGVGTWPAIWMYPTDEDYGGWPNSGEIDIMEHVGYDEGVVHATIHCSAYYWVTNTQKSAWICVPDCTSEFHVYAMEWTPEKIDVFLDDQLYFTYENEGTGWNIWPFDKKFFLILNIAIGGNWGGVQGVDDSIFPVRMEIDYVRIYQ